jgi:hypothetical protein
MHPKKTLRFRKLQFVHLEPVIFHSTNFVGFLTQNLGEMYFFSANLTVWEILPDSPFHKKEKREIEREKKTKMSRTVFFFSQQIFFNF